MAQLAQAHDGIGHQLAGAVVGDLPATLDADDLDAAALELRGIGEDVDWFEDVVGPAQPVLNEIERAIEDVAMEEPGASVLSGQ